MKKTVIKIASMLSALLLLMSTLFGVSAYAISTPCVEDHFNRLFTTGSTSNIIVRTPPSEYSCAYVAISMMLSFYDSYWRDDFIVSVDSINETDWEQGIYYPTTDILIETFNASAEAGAWDDFANSDWSNYNEFIIHPDNDHYLESYLISIAKEIGLCNEDDTVFGLNGYETVLFLEHYLHNVRGFTEDQITVHIEREVDIGNSDATLFEQMVNHINKGFPLLYGGSDFTVDWSDIEFFDQIKEQTGGHAMIAYSTEGDVDNPTDVNLHTGWSGQEHVQSVNSTEYNYFNSIIWLEINEENLPHQCTDAYRDYSDATKTYCACQIYSTHPSHNSNHISISGNSDCDEAYHWTNGCHCGKPGPDSVVIPHDLSYVVTPGSTTHYVECDECGYGDCVDHNYNQLISVSDTHHVESCVCGAVASTQEAHVASRCVSNGTSLHGIYCKCGYLISQDLHEMLIIDLRYSKCMHCGYVRDNSVPGQIIMGVEDEAENSEE